MAFKTFHLSLRANGGGLSILSGLGRAAKDHAGVAVDEPFQFCGKDEIGVVVFICAQVGAGGAFDAFANDRFGCGLKGAVAANRGPAAEILAVVELGVALAEVRLRVRIQQCFLRSGDGFLLFVFLDELLLICGDLVAEAQGCGSYQGCKDCGVFHFWIRGEVDYSL